MATDKKLKDPTEAALSAIEQALNLDQTPAGPESARVEPRLPDVEDADPLATSARRPNEPVFDGSVMPEFEREARREGGLLPPDRSLVANDDRRSIGAMRQSLRVKPSRTPYVLAVLAAAVWLAGFAALAWGQANGDIRGFLAGLSGLQGAVGAAAVLAPVLLFFIAAMLAVRAQEMRLVARAVGDVAIRLAEPEAFSTDAVLTKAQCKRLALAAHDGLARALRPSHGALDGDVVFAAATGHSGAPSDAFALTELCATAADVLARAVARGVHAATALPFAGALPAWRDRFRG